MLISLSDVTGLPGLSSPGRRSGGGGTFSHRLLIGSGSGPSPPFLNRCWEVIIAKGGLLFVVFYPLSAFPGK